MFQLLGSLLGSLVDRLIKVVFIVIVTCVTLAMMPNMLAYAQEKLDSNGSFSTSFNEMDNPQDRVEVRSPIVLR